MRPWAVRVHDVGLWLAVDPAFCAVEPEKITRDGRYMLYGLAFPVTVGPQSIAGIRRGSGTIVFRGGMAALSALLYYAMVDRAPADVRLGLSIDGREIDELAGRAAAARTDKWWAPSFYEMRAWWAERGAGCNLRQS